ncbi:MAG: substrate-binding domain-containing protein [Spirochaetes bacterium]|nr:substrate-binding domain-containing protein [Spirochaetota bacterium]
MGIRIGIVVDGLGINEWVDANVLGAEWYAQAHDITLDIAAPERIDPVEQMSVIREVSDRDPDALVVMPIQGEAVEPALSYARKRGIPVVTEDMLVRRDTPLFDVRFDGYAAGKEAGRRMLEKLDALHGGAVEEGTVAVVVSTKNPHQTDRSNGFLSALAGRPSIKTVECDITPCAEMTDHARDGIGRIIKDTARDAGARMLGCFGYGNLVTIGIVQAVEGEEGFNPPNDREHIVVSGIDACPQTLDLMKRGRIDVLVDQPCTFYIPIALHYLVRYLKEGENSLPAIGSRITEEELAIEGADPYGIGPWDVQAWSPAKMADAYGHRWFKTSGITVTPENCDAGWLWGNLIKRVKQR